MEAAAWEDPRILACSHHNGYHHSIDAADSLGAGDTTGSAGIILGSLIGCAPIFHLGSAHAGEGCMATTLARWDAGGVGDGSGGGVALQQSSTVS